MDFLSEIYEDYECRQIVMELKNVATVTRDHINQLNRYMNDSFGRFGVLVTKKSTAKKHFSKYD